MSDSGKNINQSGSNVIKLFTVAIYNFRNMLERLYLASLYRVVYCLWVIPGAYPRVERKELHSGRLYLAR
jgi:hypothetical protein